MLSAQNRMRSGSDFSAAVRRGRRAGRQSVVLHCLPRSVVDGGTAPRVGFVVPRSVGTAVVRNRVQRRLRHLMRDRVQALPAGSLLVIRAQPAAATGSDLGADLDSALGAVLRPRSSGTTDQPRRRDGRGTS